MTFQWLVVLGCIVYRSRQQGVVVRYNQYTQTMSPRTIEPSNSLYSKCTISSSTSTIQLYEFLRRNVSALQYDLDILQLGEVYCLKSWTQMPLLAPEVRLGCGALLSRSQSCGSGLFRSEVGIAKPICVALMTGPRRPLLLSRRRSQWIAMRCPFAPAIADPQCYACMVERVDTKLITSPARLCVGTLWQIARHCKIVENMDHQNPVCRHLWTCRSVTHERNLFSRGLRSIKHVP